MADDEMEKFEITDFDIENEFSGGYRGRKLTKDQQIYGIWAPSSDGEVKFFHILFSIDNIK